MNTLCGADDGGAGRDGYGSSTIVSKPPAMPGDVRGMPWRESVCVTSPIEPWRFADAHHCVSAALPRPELSTGN